MSAYDRNRSAYPCMMVAIMISSAPVRSASAWSPVFTVNGEPTMWDEKISVTNCSWVTDHGPGGPVSISSVDSSGPGVPDKLRTVLTYAVWLWRLAMSSVSAQTTPTETMAYGSCSAADGRND